MAISTKQMSSRTPCQISAGVPRPSQPILSIPGCISSLEGNHRKYTRLVDWDGKARQEGVAFE
ncbi:hypothetical protein BO71DRAFT_6930 [Aspergillus ellipticus CBS 707.79]|uniref:Uncharacterized protein n=1 Tax=Aspergillus ellipticus CBS 707.79 TaxID=1448320 RepID=A0A319D7B0_9EURO|nr:hypothetical protein BO71DRAFT_6930 [Aspergillus ellipticus CBS 707.79]